MECDWRRSHSSQARDTHHLYAIDQLRGRLSPWIGDQYRHPISSGSLRLGQYLDMAFNPTEDRVVVFVEVEDVQGKLNRRKV